MVKPNQPLKKETHRSVALGFAGNLITMGAGLMLGLNGATLPAFAAFNVGILVAVLGYWPHLFKTQAKPKARPRVAAKVSALRWCFAITATLGASVGMDQAWSRYGAEPPDPVLFVEGYNVYVKSVGERIQIEVLFLNESKQNIRVIYGTVATVRRSFIEEAPKRLAQEEEISMVADRLFNGKEAPAYPPLITDILPGRTKILILTDLVTDTFLEGLKTGQFAVYFAGSFGYSFKKRDMGLTFCGLAYPSSGRNVNCVHHNEAMVDRQPRLNSSESQK